MNKLMTINGDHFVVIYLFLFVHCELPSATILVRHFGRNESVDQFDDEEAQFGPGINPTSPIMGRIFAADPLEGCVDTVSLPKNASEYALPFVCLLKRGNCSFEEKVIAAERGGYVAAIVFNNVNNVIFPMSSKTGSPVTIPSVMVGRSDGMDILKKFTFPPDDYFVEIYANRKTDVAWYVIPVLSVLGLFILGVLCMCIFRWHDQRRRRLRRCLTSRQLKRLPRTIFIKGQTPDGKCVICLEDYEDGDRLRTLPCGHVYHMRCIDPWLLKGRRVCPICKRHVFTVHRTSQSFLSRLRSSIGISALDVEDGGQDHLLSESDSEQESDPQQQQQQQPYPNGSYGTFGTTNDMHVPVAHHPSELTPLLAPDAVDEVRRSSIPSAHSAPCVVLKVDYPLSINTDVTSITNSLPCSPTSHRRDATNQVGTSESSLEKHLHNNNDGSRNRTPTHQSPKHTPLTRALQSTSSFNATNSGESRDLARRTSTASRTEVNVVIHRTHSSDTVDA